MSRICVGCGEDKILHKVLCEDCWAETEAQEAA